MLTQAEPQQMDLGANQDDLQEAEGLLEKKIWLPKLIYDCLPYFYLMAGFAAFFATLYISEWFWILPHYLLFSAACVHLGLAIRRRRRRKPTK
jgi:fatty acid desaturase